jgi:hypothetical protein
MILDTPPTHPASYDAIRCRLSRRGLRTPNGEAWAKRREIISKLADRGQPSEIAQHLKLYHGEQVSCNAVKKVLKRLKAKKP